MEIAIRLIEDHRGLLECEPQLLEEIARRLDEGYIRSPGGRGSG